MALKALLQLHIEIGDSGRCVFCIQMIEIFAEISNKISCDVVEVASLLSEIAVVNFCAVLQLVQCEHINSSCLTHILQRMPLVHQMDGLVNFCSL